MSLLQSGMRLLQSALPTTVLYTVPSAAPVELIWLWTGMTLDQEEPTGAGARRSNADAVFHVRQGQLPSIDRKAVIRRLDDDYKIAHVEQIQDASFRLHLERMTSRAGSPARSAFQ